MYRSAMELVIEHGRDYIARGLGFWNELMLHAKGGIPCATKVAVRFWRGQFETIHARKLPSEPRAQV